MEESKFQEYYKQVKERDQKILEETPLPEAEGNNVWITFGLSLGIASIVFSFYTKFSVILGAFALVLSVIGYNKKKNNVGMAGIICSSIGFVLGIILAVGRYRLIQEM